MLKPAQMMYQKYLSLIEAGKIKPDLHQHTVAQALDGLMLSIKARGAPVTEDSFLGKALRKIGGLPPVLKGLYLHGGPGRGKSMLMDLFYKNLSIKHKKRLHFHEFMDEIQKEIFIFQQAGQLDEDPLKSIAKGIAAETKVLCFDEFFITDIADAAIMSRFFTELFKRGVIMIATSNTAPDDLYKGGLQRELFLPFIDVLKNHCDIIDLGNGTDYRQNETEARNYLTPLNLHNQNLLKSRFESMAGNKVRSKTLKHKGREILITSAGEGIGWFSFEDLCTKALGASDYLKIAETYPVVFIENIPVLRKDDRNEAKRFIHLIDALYEKRVKLICTAAASPEKLYQAGDHVQEFARTASRLEEMGAAEWPDEKRIESSLAKG